MALTLLNISGSGGFTFININNQGGTSIIVSGSVEPTPTPTVGPTATPTPTPTITLTPTSTPTPTITSTPTITPTIKTTITSTPTVTPTSTPTITPTRTPTVTPTSTPTITPTRTPTVTPTVTPTSTPTSGSTFSQTFTQGATPTTTIQNAWESFRSNLTGTYTTFTFFSNLNSGITVTHPTLVQTLADALRNATNNTSVTINSVVWRVGTGCAAGGVTGTVVEFSNIGSCSASSTYALRPRIGNANWGGVNGTTVNAPTQTITLTFS